MNREKEREYQENLAYLKEKFPQKNVELPLKLQPEVLKQRALAETKTPVRRPKIRWANAAAMVCAFVLIAGIGIYSSMNRPSAADMKRSAAAPMEAAAPMMVEAAMKTETAAYSSKTADTVLGGRYDITTMWKSWQEVKENYNIPEENVYDFGSGETGFTVISCYPDEGGMIQIVVIGGDTDIAFSEDAVIVTEISTGKQLLFQPLTLKQIG